MEICRRITISALCFFVFLCITSGAYAYEVNGTIGVQAPYPEPVRVQAKGKDSHNTCPPEYVSQNIVVSADGHLKNAVVFLKGNFQTETGGKETETPTLNQNGCNFEPHVLLVRPNHPFQIANSDPMVHDVRIFNQSEMLNRFEMKALGKTVEQTVNHPGTYVLRCGLHPWMYAFVVAVEHPFYSVTDEKGGFKLENVQTGKYLLHIWHETLGEVDVPLEVAESNVDLTYQFQSH